MDKYPNNKNISIDFVKVFASLLVLILHRISYGGILNHYKGYSGWSFFAMSLWVISFCCINLFVITTGYLMYQKQPRISSIIEIWFRTEFYLLLFSIPVWILQPDWIDFNHYNRIALFPILSRTYWYVSSYIFLCLMMPFLNALVEKFNFITIFKRIFLFYFVFFFVDVITIAYPLLLDASFSVIWLSILYIVGASIKKYDLIKKVKLKKNIILFILISISTSIITLILKNDYIPKPGANIQYSFMLWYNSPIVILMSICLFFICMKIRIPDKIHTLIHGCSKYTLDLYLIFVNPIVWHYQKSIFVVIPHEYKFLALFAAILIDFVIGYILYLYRTTIFNFLKIPKLSVAISERLFTQKKES